MNTGQQWIMMAVIGTLSNICISGSARADHEPGHMGGLFRAHETSLDLFGSASIGQDTIDALSGNRIEQDGRLGAGVGLNYFFTRYLGLGAEAYTESTHHKFIDSTSLNLVGRLPLGESGVAPYAFGGGGYQFDRVAQWVGNVGAGIEFRVHRNFAIFLDGRYILTAKTDNQGLGRAGVRLSF